MEGREGEIRASGMSNLVNRSSVYTDDRSRREIDVDMKIFGIKHLNVLDAYET